jgi:hypothetical protein
MRRLCFDTRWFLGEFFIERGSPHAYYYSPDLRVMIRLTTWIEARARVN